MQRGFEWGWPPRIPQPRIHTKCSGKHVCWRHCSRRSATVFVRPSGRCSAFEEEKKKIPGATFGTHFWCKPCRGTKACRQSFYFGWKGPCTVFLFSIQVFASGDFGINHRLNIPSVSSGWNFVLKLFEGLFSFGRKNVSALLNWDDYLLKRRTVNRWSRFHQKISIRSLTTGRMRGR